MENRFAVALEGPGIGPDGVSVDEFFAAVKGVQDAMRLMVQHLGGHEARRGQPPKWVRDQSNLRLTGIRKGSIIAELALGSPQTEGPYSEGLGVQALNSLLAWDGDEDSNLPREVTDRLFAIRARLPSSVRAWYGATDQPRMIEIRRRKERKEQGGRKTDAQLRGWLKEVNWDKRTAQLHRYGDERVRLRFDASLDDEMRRLATQHVEIKGYGRFNAKDKWVRVQVEKIDSVSLVGEPFDLEGFLNDPNPKIFRSDEIVRASEPFDVDEFNRVIREGRDV